MIACVLSGDETILNTADNMIQWGQYVFDPLVNYENWLLVEMGTKYTFTCLFM